MLPLVRGADQWRPEPGVAQFARLEPNVQKNILGPAAFEAYQAGAIKLEDVVGQSFSKDWGTTRRVKSLGEMVGKDEARKWRAVGNETRAMLQREPSVRHLSLQGENPLPFDLGTRSGDKDQDLRDLERINSLAAKEAVYAFAPDGKALFTLIGDAEHVAIEGEDLKSVPGSIITHNHPEIGSFSRGDIRFLLRTRPAELRATDERYRYWVRVGPDLNWKDVKDLVHQVQWELRPEYARRARGGEDVNLLESELSHRMWETIAQKLKTQGYSFEYHREAWDE